MGDWPASMISPCSAEATQLDRIELGGLKSSGPHLSGVIPSRIRRLRRWKSVLDPIARLTRRRRHDTPAIPRRIGVMLQWGIGDAVLALPLLKGLALSYPGASIELIGKPWLADLFGGEPWLGATHELVPPWTQPFGKYRVGTHAWRRFAAQLRALRKIRFDLLIGVRLDPRETVQLRLFNAARIAGVLGAGGEAWLTDPITLAPEDYFVRKRAEYNALALKGLTGCEVSLLPRLDVDGVARTGVLAKLHAAGYTGGPIVCIHNRAGNPIREWRAASFAAVLDLVGDLVQFVVVIDDGVDLSGPRVELPASMRSTVWKSDLANLKALLSVADVLLCCDSGVMHMGAACGCRVVAIFGPTSLDIFAPHGARHQIVKVDPMPCRPCLDSCIYSRPICMDEIIEGVVSAALRRAIVAGTDGSVWQNYFRSL
jgi:ADP-heptose:LPS heptosyltransferase